MTKKKRLLSVLKDQKKDEQLKLYRVMKEDQNILKEVMQDEHAVIIYQKNIFRLEHPHCAFYKKSVDMAHGSVMRTTLYTPDSRLHCDHTLENGEAGAMVHPFVHREKDLQALLFFLKDNKVSLDLHAYDRAKEWVAGNGLVEMALTPTPWQTLVARYMDYELLQELWEKQDKTLLRCLKELGRIKKEEITLLAQIADDCDICLLYIDDRLHGDMDEDIFHNYYEKYYKKLKKAIPNVYLTLSAKPEGESLKGPAAAYGDQVLNSLVKDQLLDEAMQPTG